MVQEASEPGPGRRRVYAGAAPKGALGSWPRGTPPRVRAQKSLGVSAAWLVQGPGEGRQLPAEGKLPLCPLQDSFQKLLRLPGVGGHLWAQTQRGAISEELPGHLTPAVYERAHLGPSWLVSPHVGWVCPHLPHVRHTHTPSTSLFSRGPCCSVSKGLCGACAPPGGEQRGDWGGEGTGPRDTPPAPSALRAISQAPQARSGPRSH